MAIEYPLTWPERMGPVGSQVFKQWLQSVQHFSAEDIDAATRMTLEANSQYQPKRQDFVELCQYGDVAQPREIASELVNWQTTGQWFTQMAYTVCQILNPSNVRAMTHREILQAVPGAVKLAKRTGLRELPEPVAVEKRLEEKEPDRELGLSELAKLRKLVNSIGRPAIKPMNQRVPGQCGRISCKNPVPPGWLNDWCPECHEMTHQKPEPANVAKPETKTERAHGRAPTAQGNTA